jgi:hypothetical protein
VQPSEHAARKLPLHPSELPHWRVPDVLVGARQGRLGQGLPARCSRAAAGRELLAAQRRFAHPVRRDKETSRLVVLPGRDQDVAKLRARVDGYMERLYRLAELK